MKRRHSLVTAFALGASIATLGACTAILGDFTTTSSTPIGDSGPGADVLTETSVVTEAGIAFAISAPAAVFVQPGKTASVAIAVTGNTSSGPITIAVTGLPAGVTAGALTINQGASTGSLVLTAAAAATSGTQATASIAASATGGSAPPVALGVTVSGASGTVDTTFPAALPYPSGLGVIQSGLVQSDGKIVLIGTFHATPGDPPQLAIRLNTDGTRDTTFDSLIGTSATASPIAVGLKGLLQPDGKIIVAWTEGASSYLNITRLLPTGALDATWHDATKATVSTTDQTFAATSPLLVALALDSDGSVTYAQFVTGSSFNVWRWTNGGVPDATIGTLGDYGRTEIATGAPALSISDIASVLPEPDGGALFVGDGAGSGSATQDLFARTTAALTLDTTFGPMATGWSSGLGKFTPAHESALIGSDLFITAPNQNPCTGSIVTFCVNKLAIGSDATDGETACPSLASGLACNQDVATRIAVGPNKTVFVGGFSGTAGGVPVVARFTTGPLASDTTYGTSGVAKLRASTTSATTGTPVAIMVTTEGLAYAVDQDAQFPLQRIWP